MQFKGELMSKSELTPICSFLIGRVSPNSSPEKQYRGDSGVMHSVEQAAKKTA
jgi:hypothetical protein